MRTKSQIIREVRNCGGDVSLDELGDIIEVWTPEEIKAYVYNVGSAYGSLNDDIYKYRKSLNITTKTSWDKAYDSLIDFVKEYDESGWFNKHSMGPVRAAERFQDILEGFRKRFQAETGNTPSMQAIQKKPSDEPTITGSITDILKYAAIGAVVIGGIYYFGKKS